jgi:hypothetical protein
MSGQPGIVQADMSGNIWGRTSAEPMYKPGSIHWEADGNAKAYIYAQAQVGLEDGSPCFKTGTAGDNLAVHTTAPATSAQVIGVAVSDVQTSYYGWLQCYGPISAVNMISGTTQLAESYIKAAITSNAAEQYFETDTGTGTPGVFGYTLAEAASDVTSMQAYLFNML